ncbi:5-formyltetrahydrofolate cyclo-ligase [Bacillus pinisoli]|uniref:5-formyltetrahydrofolate cyclo-ligase n=1 Tax=Bacillus pinisoli TaxID=2901866 RepID=UPI001FF16EBE|nr:5-formyltetrahydrofolate cyclo-ligase [Bacillus pinisoli]
MDRTKKELRLHIKSKLEKLSFYDFDQACKRIENRLYQTDEWKKSKIIGLTISRGREVETRRIIEHAWAEGKQIAVPKCLSSKKQMDFYLLTSFEQLETVYFGLQEPIIQQTVYISPEGIDLLIVPGICYTEKGYRIGYGGGYYDRYLPHYHHVTISLLLECQLVLEIPICSHDLPVQQLITEERTILCAK